MTTRKKYFLTGIAALLCFAVIFFVREKKEGRLFIYSTAVQTSYGWGYNIQKNHTGIEQPLIDTIYIKQEYIPALPGKRGFSSADDAKKTGDLVVKKISSGQLPSITLQDLTDLGIIK